MENREMELAVGDAFQIGDCIMTVIDIDGEEVAFRVDDATSVGHTCRAQDVLRPPKK